MFRASFIVNPLSVFFMNSKNLRQNKDKGEGITLSLDIALTPERLILISFFSWKSFLESFQIYQK